MPRKTPVKGFTSHGAGYRARKLGDGVIRIDQAWGGRGHGGAMEEQHIAQLTKYTRALEAAGLFVRMKMGGGGPITAYLVVARTADEVGGV